jgi:hypothetical protein
MLRTSAPSNPVALIGRPAGRTTRCSSPDAARRDVLGRGARHSPARGLNGGIRQCDTSGRSVR